MLNYSSNCNKYYQVDFIFFLLDVLHYFKKKISEEGEYISYPGEPVQHCQVRKASSQQLGKDGSG